MKGKLFLSIILVLTLAACSSNKEKDKFFDAVKKVQVGNYVGAIQEFRDIINEDPNSEYATKAMFELAKLYHGQVVKGLPEKESLSMAVEYYKKVYKRAPKLPAGERALFMAAFLDANNLQKYDEAKKLYKQFLREYPKSQLAPSAEEEIKNIGVPPEEILKKKAVK